MIVQTEDRRRYLELHIYKLYFKLYFTLRVWVLQDFFLFNIGEDLAIMESVKLRRSTII